LALPRGLRPRGALLFAEPLFNQAVAEQLGLAVIEPPEDFLVRLPEEYVGRRVRLTTAADVRTSSGPVFLKPPNRKTFPARVYAGGTELPEMPDDDPVLASEPVEWVAGTKRIPVEERAEAAVIAWMRHKTTSYDSMPIPRIKGKRREVRRMLSRRSQELLQRYRRGEPVGEDCPLKRRLAGDGSGEMIVGGRGDGDGG
jgi:hypothetical protein